MVLGLPRNPDVPLQQTGPADLPISQLQLEIDYLLTDFERPHPRQKAPDKRDQSINVE